MHESRCACSRDVACRMRLNRPSERTCSVSCCEGCSDAGQGEALSGDLYSPGKGHPERTSPQALALAEFLEQQVYCELTAAVAETNTDIAMGVWQLRQALSHVPGINRLTMANTGHGTQILQLGDRMVEVAGSATTQDIEQALANPWIKPMSITGLTSGAFQAKLAEMKQKMLDKQAAGLAKMDSAVSEGAAKLEAATDGVIAKIGNEIDDQLAEFAQFTNGGPA